MFLACLNLRLRVQWRGAQIKLIVNFVLTGTVTLYITVSLPVTCKCCWNASFPGFLDVQDDVKASRKFPATVVHLCDWDTCQILALNIAMTMEEAEVDEWYASPAVLHFESFSLHTEPSQSDLVITCTAHFLRLTITSTYSHLVYHTE